MSAASIVTATINADAHPMTASIGIPEICIPAIATTTVTPANSTERPAVALARPVASGTDMPWSRFWRWRDRTNKA